MNKRLTTRIDEETWKKLEVRSRLEGKSGSEIVREALRAHLSKATESAYEALARTGGIGVAKGLPADLSTNKEYFKGLGHLPVRRAARRP